MQSQMRVFIQELKPPNPGGGRRGSFTPEQDKGKAEVSCF